MKNIKGWLVGFSAILVLGIGGWLGIARWRPYVFHGAVLQSPRPVQDFTLTGHMEQPVSLSDFSGQFVLLYFGYTTCPDVCPTTLAKLHLAHMALGRSADQVQVLMVTVDPERDTLQVMADYITHFDPSFIALTGTPEEIAQIATSYGIFYERREDDSELGYLVDHTATVMLIDRKGYLRVVFPFGTEAEDITADLAYMLKH